MSEDEGAGCAGDSGEEAVLVVGGRSWGKGFEMGKVLFDFVGGVWFAHPHLVRSVVFFWDIEGTRTTAIISYNMAPSSSYLYRSRT